MVSQWGADTVLEGEKAMRLRAVVPVIAIWIVAFVWAGAFDASAGDAYEDQGWAPPESEEKLAFPPLKLAVADATAFAAEMEKAAPGLYSEVRVRTALDDQASLAGLDRIVQEMAAETALPTQVLTGRLQGSKLPGELEQECLQFLECCTIGNSRAPFSHAISPMLKRQRSF
jgi:hypothetical protein